MNTQVRHINLVRHHIKYETQKSFLLPIKRSFVQSHPAIQNNKECLQKDLSFFLSN